MTLKTTKLRDAITFALAVGATAVAGTGIAFAQATTPAPAPAKTLDRIEVTGSRIKRTEIETSQPVFTLNRAEIQAQGLTSIGDVIQNLSANGSALNSTFNNGGNGETQVSLRNLGSNRTLVLVNGRRWVGGTGLGGAVDLNTIPSAAVERIEVLKAGASSLYGSDAIAGVVNVILRKDYQGAEANAYIGSFDKGDGTKQSYDLTIGQTGERFSAMFGVGYVKEDPVFAGDRPISSTPTDGTGLAFASSTIPGGRFALCRGVFSNGTCSIGQTRPNGTAGQFTYDPGNSGLNQRNRTGADLYNYAPENYLLTPQERKSIFGRATLDLTDNVRAFIQGTYNNRLSEQLLAANPVVLGTGPGAGVQAKTVDISKFNIYNPFGFDVSRIQYRPVEVGRRSFKQDVNTLGISTGLDGSFERFGRTFSWDAGMVYARNDANATTDGLFNVLALKNALGPSMLVGGVPTCVATPGVASTKILGCVPLNLLGNGVITPDMANYVSFVAHDASGYKMKQYYADISGDIFELPGGMFSFAAGVEKRTEQGFSQPDALIVSGNTTGNASTPTHGGYGVKEAYVEFLIPLLKDLPFAKELSFDVATRFSDYSNFGQTTNSSFGFKWRPIADVLVRGNYAQGFRAPSILELFQGQSDSFPSTKDPCSTTFGGGYAGLTPVQVARCTAAGVPVGGYDQGNSQIRSTIGGNTKLTPETSTTKTLGVVWSPAFIQGFDVSLDWWRIELKNTVTAFSSQFILDQCIREGVQFYCGLIQRDNTGQISSLLSTNVNIGATNTEGWDLTANYRLPAMSWGQVSFQWDTAYIDKLNSDVNNDGKITDADFIGPRNRTNQVGQYSQFNNNWRIRSNLLARWEKGDFGATWFTRYYSSQVESCPFSYNDYGFGKLCSDPGAVDATNGDAILNPATASNHIGATTYHDASVYWKAPWNAKVTLGVNNVFDKQPPRAFNAFANTFDPQYEVPGRFFYMQYNQKF
jgi:iron complex outermembrane receptor protein